MNLVSVSASPYTCMPPATARTRGRFRHSPIIFVLALALGLTACGGSSSSSTTGTIAITITPTNATLAINTSQTFSATVTNTTNTTITWQVNGTTLGNSTYGTITTSGLYTAPSTVPSGAVTVTAISQADTTKTASATVTLSNTNTLSVSPALATVSGGGQQTFTALLGDQSIDAVWSLSCTSSVIGACGTISSTGVFTAPLSPPPGQGVIVIASSKNNTANAANAVATITLGNGTLYGQYAFLLSGVNGAQPFSEAGSLTFNGKGGISGGTIDHSGSAPVAIVTGGTYALIGDGRVTATIHTDSGDETWQITLINHAKSFAMRSDAVVARGDLDLQDSSQFGRALAGNFTFRITGSAPSTTIPISSMVGALNIDALGNITSGVMDVNDGGVVSTSVTASGTIAATSSSSGRGTLSIASIYGSETFAYYLVDSYTAKLIEIDGLRDYAGKLAYRTSSSAVTASTFQGNFGFVFTGANNSGTVGQGGTFTVNASGGVTNGTFDLATDTVSGLGNLFTGSLVVEDPSTGRSVMTMNVGSSTLQYVVYPGNLSYEFPFLEIDDNNATAGLALRLGSTSVV